jgi:flagellar M-ring protein FliF
MDFLKKVFAQLSDLFRSMTPAARIMAGSLLAVVAVSLVYLANYQMQGRSNYLLGGREFWDDELTRAQSALAAAGLNNFEVEGTRIRVPKHEQAAYIAALAEGNALPINWGDYLTRAASGGSLFPSAREREEQYKVARQQEVSLVLRSMPDVANASVMYDCKKKQGLSGGQIATASVGVKLLGDRNLDAQRVRMIRHFVAGAFNMDPNQVTVADLGSGIVHTPAGPDGSGNGEDHRHLAFTEAYRKEFEERVRNALSYVPGVTVVANVELSTETLHKVDQRKHDSKAAPRSADEHTSIPKGDAAKGSSRGQEAQQPNAPARIVDAGKPRGSQEEMPWRPENNLVNYDHTQLEKIGLTPERVTVSIGVPSTYFEEVWRRRNPMPQGQSPQPPDQTALVQIELEEIPKIKKHVANLLPKTEGLSDSTLLVDVMKFSVNPPPEISPPAFAPQALTWLAEYWMALGAILLGVASLLALRSTIRAARPPGLHWQASRGAEQAPTAEHEEHGRPSRGRTPHPMQSGETIRADLIDMVRENPDRAAAILRGWIGNPS